MGPSLCDVAGDPVYEGNVEDLVADGHVEEQVGPRLTECIIERVSEVGDPERDDADDADAAPSDDVPRRGCVEIDRAQIERAGGRDREMSGRAHAAACQAEDKSKRTEHPWTTHSRPRSAKEWARSPDHPPTRRSFESWTSRLDLDVG